MTFLEPDPYLMALIEAFDQESRKYIGMLNSERSINLQASGFRSRNYFGRTDIISQKDLDNCYKASFFSAMAVNVGNVYRDPSLKNKSVDIRFNKVQEYISDLKSQATKVRINSQNFLNLRTFGIYEQREKQDHEYYYWIAGLDAKLLADASILVRRVKYEVDLYLNKLNTQKGISNDSSSDCFVVTATCGTPYAAEVLKYRCFRDKYLSRFFLGHILIDLYNFVGPGLAAIVRKNSRLKFVMAKILYVVSLILPEVMD